MKAQTNRRFRQLHLYLGVFFAPAIILFAISGALQTFRLQETKGYGGTPPQWIVWIASVHKDQVQPRAEPEGTRAPAAKARPKSPQGQAAAPRHDPLPLKIFVGFMSIGLLLSALLGIVLALATRSTRRVSMIMLAAGAVVPLALLFV